MTTLQKVIQLAKTIYEEMEANRLGATASKFVQALSLSTLQPYSTKAGKFDALIAAKEDPNAIRLALDALKKDPEFNSSVSLKNIVMILDHLVAAAMNTFAHEVGMETRAVYSPIEVAQEAMDALTPTYHEQFANVAQRHDFLLLVQRKLTESANAESQHAKQAYDVTLQRATTTNAQQENQFAALQQAHQQELATVNATLNDTKAELSVMRTSAAADIKNLDTKLTTLHQKALALKEKNQALQQKNVTLQHELVGLANRDIATELANAQSNLAAKCEHAHTLQSQIDSLSGAYEAERARNETLSHENHRLKSQLDEMRLKASAKSLHFPKSKHNNTHDNQGNKPSFSK